MADSDKAQGAPAERGAPPLAVRRRRVALCDAIVTQVLGTWEYLYVLSHVHSGAA